MIPTISQVQLVTMPCVLFQSRNRETYDSNEMALRLHWLGLNQFQSRNRETYDSNVRIWEWDWTVVATFQSRNRETYDSNSRWS